MQREPFAITVCLGMQEIIGTQGMVPTGFHGAELADIQFGDTVAVIGIGPVGLMSVAAAAIRGAADIYAVGSRKNCAQLALEFGATAIINYREGDIVEQIMEKTSGKGVDRYYCCRRRQ